MADYWIDEVIAELDAFYNATGSGSARIRISDFPLAIAPNVSIASVSSVDEDGTQTLTASVSGGTYDSLSYAWAIVSGGGTITGSGASVTYTPPDVTANANVTVRCTVTATGSGTNAVSGTSDTATDTEVFTVNFVESLPDAAAPTVTIGAVANVNEGTDVALTATLSGGTYDTITFAWDDGGAGGAFSSSTAQNPTYTAPSVTSHQSATFTCETTARGTGTDASNGTSDTASDTEAFSIRNVPAGPALELTDWTTPTGETVIVLALVQANISGVDLFDAPGDEVGTGNDLVIGADLSLDMVERHPSGQLPVRLRKTGAGDFSTYFNTGGTYENAALYIQTTPTKVIGFTHGNSAAATRIGTTPTQAMRLISQG